MPEFRLPGFVQPKRFEALERIPQSFEDVFTRLSALGEAERARKAQEGLAGLSGSIAPSEFSQIGQTSGALGRIQGISQRPNQIAIGQTPSGISSELEQRAAEFASRKRKEAEVGQRTKEAAASKAEAEAGISAKTLMDAIAGKVEPKEARAIEKQIRDRFDDQTKEFREQMDSFARVKALASRGTAAGDLGLIFAFMKTFDPRSVVRESEFRTAEQARAWLSRAQDDGVKVPAFIVQGIQKLASGATLLPEQRADMVATAEATVDANKSIFEQRRDESVALAQKLNVDPESAVPSLLLSGKGKKVGRFTVEPVE